MRYQRLSDNTSLIVTETGESELFSSSLATDRNICRKRKLILILLLIQSFLCTILLTVVIRLLINDKDDIYRQGIRSSAPIFIAIIYYGWGLLVVYLYSHIGIYTFAWLGFLQYISLCIEIFFNIIALIRHPLHDQKTKFGFHAGLIITIISVMETILLVITLKFTFKLVRLIKTYKRAVLEQI